jgi:hypothetical protein
MGLALVGFFIWWLAYYRHTDRYKEDKERRARDAAETERLAKLRLNREREISIAQYHAKENAKAEKKERKKARKLPSIQEIRSGQVELRRYGGDVEPDFAKYGRF